jgi:uncharacterized protein
MPAPNGFPPGCPIWADLFTSDPDRAEAFYGEIFGWKAEHTGEDFGGYINFFRDGQGVGGAMKNDGASGQPDAWSVYLHTDDSKATADAVRSHGGQVIVEPMAVGDLGTMGVYVDVDGAVIGSWERGTHTGFGIIGEHGAPSWFELHTRDYAAAVAFYRDVFGWDAHTAADDPEFKYTTLGSGESQRAGIMDASGFLPEGMPSHWNVYFEVDDPDATLAQIERLGGAIVTPAEDTPYGRLATATDPTGALFRLMHGN